MPTPASAGDRGGNRPVGSQPTYYTFKGENGGGVAAIWVDKKTGRITTQEVLAESLSFLRPHKIKVSESGSYLLATSPHAARHNLLLVDLVNHTHQFLSVDRMPDDLAAWQDSFVVGAEAQMCYIVDAVSGKVARRWNGKHQLRPDGRRIEYVATTSDGTAWTSWQKDSGSGTREGSRVVTIDIASGKTLADLRMPRAMPQLHLADAKEQGPNPEIIIPSTRTNTLLLSMDLYGGIAMADLDAAREGSWRGLTYHSVAPDQSWGTAFPDRALVYPSGSKDYVFIANAGIDGGVSWVDLKERRIVQTLSSPPGLSAPVSVAAGRYLVAPVPGKLKSRSFGALREGRQPLAELCVFEVGGRSSAPVLSMRSVPLPVAAQLAAPVSSETSDIVLLSAGSEFLVVRAATGEVVDRQDALGRIARLAFR
ncbi:MAG TPA: hypothetical protein PLA50_03260 [Bacteroidia bacterium]|nr:hypothetical protein [Bacteroidia bacterium]